jgi:hypothetical protein
MGNLLVLTIQLLEESLIVEMNIERNIAMQKFLCCGAANPKMHGMCKKQLTIRHGCPMDRSVGAIFGRIYANSPIIGGIFVLKPFGFMEPRMALAVPGHSGHCSKMASSSSIFRVVRDAQPCAIRM